MIQTKSLRTRSPMCRHSSTHHQSAKTSATHQHALNPSELGCFCRRLSLFYCGWFGSSKVGSFALLTVPAVFLCHSTHKTPLMYTRQQPISTVQCCFLSRQPCDTLRNVRHHQSAPGVISEGQTTETRLCSRTIVISENCLRSNTNVF